MERVTVWCTLAALMLFTPALRVRGLRLVLPLQRDREVAQVGVVQVEDDRHTRDRRSSGTRRDDAAAAPITSGAAPYTGQFRPERSLSGVAGHAGGADCPSVHLPIFRLC